MNEHKCPHCGGDISSEIEAAFFAQRSIAGKTPSQKKEAARRTNMKKLNASYTTEKRKAAAAKRAETMAKKKKLNTP